MAEEIKKEFSLPPNVTVWTLTTNQENYAKSIGLGVGENQAMVLAMDMKLSLIIDDGDAQRFAEEQFGIDVFGSLEFLRAAFISCAIERTEYDMNVTEFAENDRANLSQIQWAQRASK